MESSWWFILLRLRNEECRLQPNDRFLFSWCISNLTQHIKIYERFMDMAIWCLSPDYAHGLNQTEILDSGWRSGARRDPFEILMFVSSHSTSLPFSHSEWRHVQWPWLLSADKYEGAWAGISRSDAKLNAVPDKDKQTRFIVVFARHFCLCYLYLSFITNCTHTVQSRLVQLIDIHCTAIHLHIHRIISQLPDSLTYRSRSTTITTAFSPQSRCHRFYHYYC